MATDQTTRLEAATVKAENGSQIVYDFANGPATATVQTASGPIPTLAGKLEEISDTLSISSGIYPTTAAALDATSNGQIFLVYASDDDDIIYRVYRNDNGAAVDTGKNTISGADLEAALQQANQSAQQAQQASQIAQESASSAVAAVQDFKGEDGASLVGFNEGSVAGRLSTSFSVQDLSKDISAATLAQANQLLNVLPSHSIVEWGPYNYLLDQAQLDAKDKTILHVLNGSTFNGDYDTALPGISYGVVEKGVRYRRLRGASSTDLADLMIERKANYTGGTAGFVNSAFRAETTVSQGATAFEWGIVSLLENYAVGTGENCAAYNVARKRADGSTWALVTELRDFTVSPATASVSQEFDMFANGADVSHNRVLLDLVIGKNDASGAAPDVGYGLRITPQNQNVANMGKLFEAIHVQGNVGTILRGEGTGDFLVKDVGTRTVGLDLIEGVYSNAAMRIASNAKVTLDSTGSVFVRYNSSVARTEIGVGSAAKFGFSNDGQMFDAGGLQLLTTRQKGWAAATGTASRLTYATDTVTLPQLAQRVKALIDDLTSHGLIGA